MFITECSQVTDSCGLFTSKIVFKSTPTFWAFWRVWHVRTGGGITVDGFLSTLIQLLVHAQS